MTKAFTGKPTNLFFQILQLFFQVYDFPLWIRSVTCSTAAALIWPLSKMENEVTPHTCTVRRGRKEQGGIDDEEAG